MLKDEQDCSHNRGGDARPQKSWSYFSTIQYSAPDDWNLFSRKTLFFAFLKNYPLLLALWNDLTDLNQE